MKGPKNPKRCGYIKDGRQLAALIEVTSLIRIFVRRQLARSDSIAASTSASAPILYTRVTAIKSSEKSEDKRGRNFDREILAVRMAERQVWLITGASSGFGLEIALAALKAGHKIIGSVRSRQKSADAVQRIESAGGKTIELDLSKDAKSIQAGAKQAEGVFGKIDTLINNAGYSLLGAIEDLG